MDAEGNPDWNDAALGASLPPTFTSYSTPMYTVSNQTYDPLTNGAVLSQYNGDAFGGNTSSSALGTSLPSTNIGIGTSWGDTALSMVTNTLDTVSDKFKQNSEIGGLGKNYMAAGNNTLGTGGWTTAGYEFANSLVAYGGQLEKLGSKYSVASLGTKLLSVGIQWGMAGFTAYKQKSLAPLAKQADIAIGTSIGAWLAPAAVDYFSGMSLAPTSPWVSMFGGVLGGFAGGLYYDVTTFIGSSMNKGKK